MAFIEKLKAHVEANSDWTWCRKGFKDDFFCFAEAWHHFSRLCQITLIICSVLTYSFVMFLQQYFYAFWGDKASLHAIIGTVKVSLNLHWAILSPFHFIYFSYPCLIRLFTHWFVRLFISGKIVCHQTWWKLVLKSITVCSLSAMTSVWWACWW